MNAAPLYLAELATLKRDGLVSQLPPVPTAPAMARQRSARITAAVDQYLAQLAEMRRTGELTASKTYGVLKAICLRHGVRANAVCNRIAREHRSERKETAA